VANGINVKNICLGKNVVSGYERNCCADEKFLTISIAKLLIIHWRFEQVAERKAIRQGNTCISHNIIMLLWLLHSRYFLFLPLLFSHIGHDASVNIRRRDFHNEFVEHRQCKLRLWEIRNVCNVCHFRLYFCSSRSTWDGAFLPDCTSIFSFFVFFYYTRAHTRTCVYFI